MNTKQLFNRIGKALRGPDREEQIRSYLDGSVSIYDLERRQREVEQGRFRGLL